ncbi:unnamed protein product [Rotaria sordida]|uniref:Uncharacterized protein n=2 Tax=Rotaria sordida TaxID=392033 RepID=A0A814UED8_9BILA|nr:unnamed protein product [Rotaria sordida]CAF1430381.1 unnamed protein product [Rotaria sordida]
MPRKKSQNIITVPRVDIVLLIVGTRGDVQPFVALGRVLLAAGHRVRLATHETFRKFVRGNGLEFFPLAGNPADLMSFVVKNSGIIPSISSIAAGDLIKHRHVITDILTSTWHACTVEDDETGKPFTAEAIIANPPSFGHIHCAHKLQIPLHIMFTMPWSPTTAFPHPFFTVDYSKASVEKVNMLSYSAVEMFAWSSMRDIVNEFRNDTLGLPSLHTRQATYMMIDERVPFTYCWSPSFVPKPNDWASYINVSGFFFLDHDATTDTKIPDGLVKFLGLSNHYRNESLSPVIYIGFGSITGYDSDRILYIILEALEKTGYRAVLSGLAKDNDKLPKNVFKIDNISHDWLFQHVSAVCHHGGAGTTAAGLRAGKPTIIVPFFGDQFFWGNAIEKNGAGPRALPGKNLTADDLAEAFKFVHQPKVRAAAERIRDAILKENGCEEALRAFHTHLPTSRMRSDLESTYTACYTLNEFHLQISRHVAQVLVISGRIKATQLHLHSTRYWPSMFDNRIHPPFHGIIKHSQKAIVQIFSDTTTGFKQAMHSHTWTKSTYNVVESVLLGLINGIGHLCIGCLSLYGELTDVLNAVPSYYDPYNESSYHSRPYVIDFDTGINAAMCAFIDGWKDGMMDVVTKPRIGYERHGKLGGVAGLLIGVVNSLFKPVVGTLSSLTWFCRGIYANINNERLVDKGLETYTVNTLGLGSLPSTITQEELKQHYNNNMKQTVKTASIVSGFSPDVCQQIINDFDNIKKQYVDDRLHKYKLRRSDDDYF